MKSTPQAEKQPQAQRTHLYRHFDKDGRLLYVGISLSALSRLAQHREHRHWFDAIARVEIQSYPTRQAAREAERESIRKERPEYNIRDRDDLQAARRTRHERAVESANALRDRSQR